MSEHHNWNHMYKAKKYQFQYGKLSRVEWLSHEKNLIKLSWIFNIDVCRCGWGDYSTFPSACSSGNKSKYYSTEWWFINGKETNEWIMNQMYVNTLANKVVGEQNSEWNNKRKATGYMSFKDVGWRWWWCWCWHKIAQHFWIAPQKHLRIYMKYN